MSMHPGFTVTLDKTRTVGGPFNPYGNDDIAYIGHFITKSEEECRDRRSRKRADTAVPREEGWEKFFNMHDKNDVLNLDFVNFQKGAL